jgi:hypothetical protein
VANTGHTYYSDRRLNSHAAEQPHDHILTAFTGDSVLSLNAGTRVRGCWIIRVLAFRLSPPHFRSTN